MPKANQKSVTLPKRIYKQAEAQAAAEGKSVARFVTDLILERTAQEGGGHA
jgi:predicted HicB family RNase H-like nuclease